MSIIQLEAQERAILGKGCKKLHKEGKLPAVIYGKNYKNLSISLDSKATIKAIENVGKTSIVDVIITTTDNQQKKESVLFWNVKRNPVKNTIEHVDLYRISEKEKVKVRIPLVISGTSKGVKLGGKLEVYREYIDIMAYPKDLIKEVVVDITDLGANETIYLNDIVVPSTISKLYTTNIAVLSITLNTASEEPSK